MSNNMVEPESSLHPNNLSAVLVTSENADNNNTFILNSSNLNSSQVMSLNNPNNMSNIIEGTTNSISGMLTNGTQALHSTQNPQSM